MLHLYKLIFLIIAVWRITSIVYSEGIFKPVRNLIGIEVLNHDDPPEFWFYPDNFIGELFSCFWCLSVWIAILVMLFSLLPYSEFVLLPFVMSAGAITIEHILNYLRKDND